ncbi:MAG: hemolysin family protein [Bacteroidia bacterium]|nr:hemolysin family protein [Bacteroidia bacterium]MDW8235589.1 hemolysin family protein [Bacteroidia bacterium]
MSWIIVGALAIILSAWASGSEMAWVSASPLHWEAWRSRHPHRWRIVHFFLQKPRRLLITVLLANNIALVIFSAAISALLSPLYPLLGKNASFWVETLLGTLILLIGGEYLPKALFRQWQHSLLPAVVPITGFLYILLSPLVEIIYYGTTGFFSLIGLEERRFEKPLSRESVAQMVRTSEPAFQNVLARALALSETPVREFMIPRREIVAVSSQTPLHEVYKTFIQTELSRVIVYENTLDHVVGYVYVRSLLKEPQSLTDIIEPVAFVPETMPADRLLEEIIQKRLPLAVVVDARGGVAGLVTVEDIAEEVFGEIEDERELPVRLEENPTPDVYELDARLEIDYLNEKYGLGLPTKEAVTIGGLALEYLGYLPSRGTTWEAYGFHWEVLDAIPQRIVTLRLKRI